AGKGDGLGLVAGDPIDHAITQAPPNLAGIRGKPCRRIGRRPPASLLQGLRKVQVIERGQWSNAVLQQRLDEALVEIETRRVQRTGSRRDHSGPADREPIAAQAKVGHQLHVLLPALVVVASHISGLAALDRTRFPAELVPDPKALAVGVPCAFDLVGGGRSAPHETRGIRGRDLLELARHGVTAWRRCHRSLKRSKWIALAGCSRTRSSCSVSPSPGPCGSPK